MERYDLTQAFLVIGAVYEARRSGTHDVLYTVRGELMSTTPKFRLVDAAGGAELATLEGNFLKTRYDVVIGGKSVASISFPAVTLKKKLTLSLESGDVYEADGGVLSGVFRCKSQDGEPVLEIGKKLALRDTFTVARADKMPVAVALLAAVAIHSRFYDVV